MHWIRNRLKPPARAAKRWLLERRRAFARRLVAGVHRSARRPNSGLPFAIVVFSWIYLLKRLLQETLARGWPLRGLRRDWWLREMRSAFTMKLAQWSSVPAGWRPDDYGAHRRVNRLTERDRVSMRTWQNANAERPLISVLVPVYDAEPAWIARLVGSVLAQVYDRWELVLVDDASPNQDVWPTLAGWAERDARIVVERLAKNRGVCAATNRAAELASGAFLAFADHDDELTPDALWYFARTIVDKPIVDLLYSDEEIVPPADPPYPMFKPGWSPELLTAFNYICHLLVLRRTVFDAVGGLQVGTEGVQDFDLILRTMPQLRTAVHIPRVLYRWHVVPQSLSRQVDSRTGQVVASVGIEAKTQAVVNAHLARLGWDAAVDIVGGWALPRFHPKPVGKVAVVVCTKDNHDCLRAAVRSIEKRTEYADYELLVIDNGATNPEAVAHLAELGKRHRVVRIENGPDGFNWSRLNNAAARLTDAEFLLFLNDDVEVLDAQWLSALTQTAAQPGVGAVGARLEYPDGRIQHAGVIVGAHGWGPWHVLMGARLSQPTDYRGVWAFPRNCAAVTGACLMTKRADFLRLGGFDETELRVGFSDVDYCLRLLREGLRVAYAPQARLIHKEGQSRGLCIDPSEAAALSRRWRGFEDPYWNANLSRETHIPTIMPRRRCRIDGDRELTIMKTGGLRPPLVSEEIEVLIADGWEADAEVRAAHRSGVPTLWRLERRAMVDSEFSAAAVARLIRQWRTLALPYQTAFPDAHTRAWAQAGMLRENARILEAVAPIVEEHELADRRVVARATLGLGADDVMIATSIAPGEEAALDVLIEAVDAIRQAGARFVLGLHPCSVGLERESFVALSDLAAADVFVSQPLVELRGPAVLEALACGLPLVGTRLLENADVVHFGVTGIEVAPLDAASLRNALVQLLDDELRESLGRQSRNWLASRQSPEGVAAMWVQLCQEAKDLDDRSASGADQKSGKLGGNCLIFADGRS